MMRLRRFFYLSIGIFFAGHAWADGCHLKKYGTMPVEMDDSRPMTMVKINGINTRFIVDTGSFYNSMSTATATSLGLKLRAAPFGFRIVGVGGVADVQQAHVEQFGILDSTLKNVDFIVGGSDPGYGLLSANLLDIADLEIDLARGKMTLFKADHCDKTTLAYWVKDGKYNTADIEKSNDTFDRRTFVAVTINGSHLRAVIDSGASYTAISLSAAKRVGLNLDDPNGEARSSSGVGAKSVRAWTARVDSFSVGTETIQHSKIEVLDGNFGDDTDMLLGADFILAHHIFIANSQNKIYFTYNGGRMFTSASAPSDSANSDAGSATDEAGAAPKTAADYALVGEAHLSRGEPKAAIAALDEAIHRAPDQAAYYSARARAYAQDKQVDAVRTDLDRSLSLDPKNVDTLLMRAEYRIAHEDIDGATADVKLSATLVSAGSAQAHTVAELYLELIEPAAAVPFLDDWIRLHLHDVMLGAALNQRCWARALSNQMLDAALDDCRKSIKRDGEKPGYLDSLGMVELRLGQYADSIKTYERAIAKNPKSAWSHYGLGLAKIHAGQKDAGNADLEVARAIDSKINADAAKDGLSATGL